MNEAFEGTIRAIALKPEHKGPMRLVDMATVREDGLEGNVGQERHITLLAQEQWDATQRELGGELPWETRRANILVEGIASFSEIIGHKLNLGDVTLRIVGETHPCSQMDHLQPGLQAALKPECRGGVHGRVVNGGTIRVGDRVSLSDARRNGRLSDGAN
ncbi:MAG: MOSC domain-containing protein [Candidatus Hydrogenedentes bacterium]|nr:MOSC domain-containing protein [Candidatus Hydrogenedentota bacterium]